MEEINLDNPIFTFYVDISGMSRQNAAGYLAEFKDRLSYSNVTIWVVPLKDGDKGQTRVECTYAGRINSETHRLNTELNELIELISDSESLDSLKGRVRDWRINKIIT